MRDIVLRKDETAAGQTYEYARIVAAHASTDGKVKSADVEYKIPGENKFRVTARPTHKLMHVVPVEEQTMDKGKLEDEVEEEEETDPGKQGETTRDIGQVSQQKIAEKVEAQGPAVGSFKEPDLKEAEKEPEGVGEGATSDKEPEAVEKT